MRRVERRSDMIDQIGPQKLDWILRLAASVMSYWATVSVHTYPGHCSYVSEQCDDELEIPEREWHE